VSKVRCARLEDVLGDVGSGSVHRILLKGGVFLYPPTKKAPSARPQTQQLADRTFELTLLFVLNSIVI
jgi:hypothetical protein